METDLRPDVLRAMRAWTKLNQAEAADAIGISKRLLYDAELGNVLTERTWTMASAFYASRGLHWRGGDGPCAILIDLREVG